MQHVLRDGTTVSLRTCRPDDRAQLIALFHRMGPLSIRHRYSEAKRELTDGDLSYLTSDRCVAVAATVGDGVGEQILGIGRYVVLSDPPDVAEVAFEVGDADQGRGIGTILLRELVLIARDRGIIAFRAEVEVDNRLMCEVFAHSHLLLRQTADAGIVRIELALADPAIARTRCAPHGSRATSSQLATSDAEIAGHKCC